MARGRGVAVLYADAGNKGSLNVEALETLVRVAGLTVELLAASQVPAPVVQPAAPVAEEAAPAVEQPEPEQTAEPAYAGSASEEASYAETEQPAEEVYTEETTTDVPFVSEPEEVQPEVESFAPVPDVHEVQEQAEPQFEAAAETVENVAEYTGEVTYEVEQTASYSEESVAVEPPVEAETFAPVAEVPTVEEPAAVEESEPVAEFDFTSNGSYDASHDEPAAEPVVEEPVMEEPAVPMVEAPVPAAAVSVNGNAEVATVAEPVVEVASAEPKKSRFSDRNVDLPIEVPDGERRLHNDARRFARLLVSEIKLYNEEKVTQGRESGDLYERLKEAIDRSREMYDKRVQPAVASKFDYFHYEVVNSLAEGQDTNLGSGYPGATV
jgi:hypothetical protein